jgi:hypothetical protein
MSLGVIGIQLFRVRLFRWQNYEKQQTTGFKNVRLICNFVRKMGKLSNIILVWISIRVWGSANGEGLSTVPDFGTRLETRASAGVVMTIIIIKTK